MVSISMQDLNMRFHFGYYEAFGCSHGPEDFERVIEAMKILVTDGFVATNIGNAFYRNGLKYFLNKAIPEAETYFIGDISANYWTINGKPPENEFNYLKYFD